jgi:hypothetical protein
MLPRDQHTYKAQLTDAKVKNEKQYHSNKCAVCKDLYQAGILSYPQ